MFFFIHFSYSSLLPSSHFPIQTKRSSALSDNLFHKIVKSFSQSTPTRNGEYDQDPVTSRSLGQGYGRPLPPQTPRSLLFQPIDGVKWRHHPRARLVIGAAVSVSLATLKAEWFGLLTSFPQKVCCRLSCDLAFNTFGVSWRHQVQLWAASQWRQTA